MEEIKNFINQSIQISENFRISVKGVLIVLVIFIITALILKFVKRLITRKLPEQDKLKFNSVFSFAKFFIYLVVVLVSLQNMGAQLTAVLTASAALLVGI